MISRLRKIFYDEEGWNAQLIRGAASIEGRYMSKVIPCEEFSNQFSHVETPLVRRYLHQKVRCKRRIVLYKKTDRIHPELAGKIPEIYINDHQDVQLPTGYFCDLGHTLAGLDALNHPQIVSPLPSALRFLYRLFPYVSNNAFISTWLGDIASSSADFLMAYLNGCDQTMPALQQIIDKDASPSDMYGNLDAFVIHKFYDTGSSSGQLVTDIFRNYYERDDYIKYRFQIACDCIGLRWDGSSFVNKEQWLSKFTRELRDNTSFQMFSETESFFEKFSLPWKIWKNKFPKVLRTRLLLEILITALKVELIEEGPIPYTMRADRSPATSCF